MIKVVQDLYSKSYKTVLREIKAEIKEDINNWRDILCWKIQYCYDSFQMIYKSNQ